MAAERRTIVCEDPGALATAVAERIVALSTAPGDRPISIALSGGSTPKRLFETLATPPFAASVLWERLELFFGDERSVAPDHADSNYGMARRAMLLRVPVRAHRMRAESGEAEAYEKLVVERVAPGASGMPSFDLVLLGLGPDGHTASLFPATAALAERRRLVVMNEVPQLGTRRMTFTYPLINAAKRVWILVAGADKRAMVASCLAAEGRENASWPVLGVDPSAGELVWWLDRAAAGESNG